ncbi:sugar transferase [Altererythrobacter arenosus]|uniref:Sugar transferase n=1 Tax=Altererythrobacter arenosus TaxID=3032592 RepID=A0ABY8FUM3_9SPHN|nr:sugar transferase [Altererythrobacter sp. CAU 1644]WFL78703.1 sugar transferase [Altererythrobacter sp. CAU 1644]
MARAIPLSDPVSILTLSEVFVANVCIWYVLNRLQTYARVRLLSYVVPVNLTIFAALILVNNLLRVGYSISLLGVCAVATILISYLVTIKVRNSGSNFRHFLVPGGAITRLKGMAGYEEVGCPQLLERMINEDEISGSIVADLHQDLSAEWERLLAKAALRGIPVYHCRLIEEALTGEVRINHLRENELGSLIPNLPYRYAKRVFDVVAVLLFAPIVLPLVCVIAMLIRLDSPGPAFFFQSRVGFRGETFRMVKLRTMRVVSKSTSANSAREFAMTKDNDDRITKIGRFLRKTRLDELPQAWNVLIGDMSWIGPRPEAADLALWHEGEIPFYSYRHIVRPGITGWAQVNQGHVTDLDSIEHKLRLDFYYVKNLSLWLDVLIALKTFRVIAGGVGAR